nr:MAG TPA: hypothetical protein [Caudoviricetes sp.]
MYNELVFEKRPLNIFKFWQAILFDWRWQYRRYT